MSLLCFGELCGLFRCWAAVSCCLFRLVVVMRRCGFAVWCGVDICSVQVVASLLSSSVCFIVMCGQHKPDWTTVNSDNGEVLLGDWNQMVLVVGNCRVSES